MNDEPDDVAWDALLDALVRIEGLSAADSGLLSFGATAGNGGIFVDGGRICWAAAPGLQGRLRDLLQHRADLRDVDLDGVYERCRAEGRQLGQTLVAEGLIAAPDLEAVLRRHSAESLVALCRSVEPTVWSSRSGPGYAPQFTFRPVDVLFDVVALIRPDAHAAGLAGLAGFAAPGRRGAAFLRSPGDAAALPLARVGDASVQALRTLGRWALSLPVATDELGASARFTLAATASGETIAVWWRGALLYAVVCEDRRALADVTAQHLAAA
jgi:hypothetical protein